MCPEVRGQAGQHSQTLLKNKQIKVLSIPQPLFLPPAFSSTKLHLFLNKPKLLYSFYAKLTAGMWLGHLCTLSSGERTWDICSLLTAITYQVLHIPPSKSSRTRFYGLRHRVRLQGAGGISGTCSTLQENCHRVASTLCGNARTGELGLQVQSAPAT